MIWHATHIIYKRIIHRESTYIIYKNITHAMYGKPHLYRWYITQTNHNMMWHATHPVWQLLCKAPPHDAWYDTTRPDGQMKGDDLRVMQSVVCDYDWWPNQSVIRISLTRSASPRISAADRQVTIRTQLHTPKDRQPRTASRAWCRVKADNDFIMRTSLNDTRAIVSMQYYMYNISNICVQYK